MRKIFKFLMVIALITFVRPIVASAESVDLGLFKADNSITVTERMEGSGFVAGNMVTVNNEVDGMLFAAGNVVNVSSRSDYMFAAGSQLNITDASFKDGFVAGSIIEFNNVAVDRDLYVAGQKITLKGNVGRNAYIAGDNVIIDGIIGGDLYVDASSIVINSNTVVNGTLSYNEDTEVTISKDAMVTSTSTYKNVSTNSNPIDVNVSFGTTFVSKLISKLISLVNILLVGLLMVLLIPSLFKKLSQIEVNKLLPSFAWGLLILIVGPILALIAMLTYVGIATGMITGVIYGLLLYLSTIFSTFVVTSLILKNKVKNPYLILLIGLPCLYIIKLIPFLGGLVSFGFLCLGLGLLTNLIKRK